MDIEAPSLPLCCGLVARFSPALEAGHWALWGQGLKTPRAPWDHSLGPSDAMLVRVHDSSSFIIYINQMFGGGNEKLNYLLQ